jgi:hypothetical protein
MRSVWLTFLLLEFLLMGSCVVAVGMMQDKEVFQTAKSFMPGSPGENSYVTPVFELTGRDANVEVDIQTDVDNQWVYFNLALINDGTGQAWDWGREVSHYTGRDSDGSWSEGSSTDSSTLGHISAGKYYLRVEPEWSRDPSSSAGPQRPIRYTLTVKRDVPVMWPYMIAFVLLFIPPIWKSIRIRAFEQKRWAESDYG